MRNLSPIRVFPSLRDLELSYCEITADSFSEGLPPLRSLGFSYCGLRDTDWLCSLASPDSLRSLDLLGNKIGSIAALESLHLSGCGLTDSSFVSAMPVLRYLDLSASELTDISAIGDLRFLRFLSVSCNRITDLGLIYPLLMRYRNVIDVDEHSPVHAALMARGNPAPGYPRNPARYADARR